MSHCSEPLLDPRQCGMLPLIGRADEVIEATASAPAWSAY
jgi:hypothetical protein